MIDDLPFEFSRGGFTWGSSRDIGDDVVVAMFTLGGEVLPTHWAEQAFPAVGDLIRPDIVGAMSTTAGLLVVKVRRWQQANLLMIGLVRVAKPEEDGQ